MGVTHRSILSSGNEVKSDTDLSGGDYLICFGDVESVEVDKNRRLKNKSKVVRGTVLNRVPNKSFEFGIMLSYSAGWRKWRRIRNELALYALAADTDICENFSDIVPQNGSPFSELFDDSIKMKAWVDFMESEETAQNEVLSREISRNASRKLEDDIYTAATCFSRLPNRFKRLFCDKNLPAEILRQNEEKLRSFFLTAQDLTQEWISPCISSSFHRLILHGVSNYLFLHSKGVGKHPDRVVKVRNLNSEFIPPNDTLVNFISKLWKPT